MPSKEAVLAVKELWKQVGGELRPHSSFKSTNCPGNSWRMWIDNKLTFITEEIKAQEVVQEVTRSMLVKKGDKGQQVEEIQIMLNLVNKKQLAIDSDFGAKTLAAVVSFQKKYKLKPDGVVGNMTYAKLIEVNRAKINKGKAFKIE